LLHGVRSNEQDLMGLAPMLDDRFRIISVRAPLVLGPGAYGWYNVEFHPGFVINEEEAKEGLRLLLRFLGGLPQPLYLMGFSQGCILSLSAALTAPEGVAGVVGMSGRWLDALHAGRADPEHVRGLPVMVVHGTGDNVIPIETGRALRDQLAQLPVELTYREYDMGHHVTKQSMADISAWLSARLGSPDWRSGSA
jgi:phospholipase/carboxylesterase